MVKILLISLIPELLSAQSLSIDPNLWNLSTSTAKTAKLYSCSGGALCFDFPTQKYKTVNYLTTAAQPLIGAARLVAQAGLVTTGTPVFGDTDPSNSCNFPAHFRLYFEADGAVWTDFTGDTFRWWSNPIAFELTSGGNSGTLTVPLTPDQWSTVFGRKGDADAQTLSGFQASIQNTAVIGGTLGRGCFFGHGLNVSGGTAQFQLLGFRVVGQFEIPAP